MYKHFFGLSENPFNVNPDPRFLYLTQQTRETLDELTYGIQARKGLILLTGEVWTGKTTLINRVLDWLHQQQTPTAFIFNSHLETRHLFDFILADFGVPSDTRWNGNALMCLNQWLIERYRAGDIPVLIVDEAQGLTTDVLEEIRMLLNLETAHDKLLQIVLAGQPELEERLKRPDLRQLKQRVVLRCRTTALTREETHDYIQARLHIAGANGTPVFSSQTMDAVHFYSRGIPRVTNLLCDHALNNAYVDGVRPVPVQIVEEIAREFQLDDIKPLAPSIDSEGAMGAVMIAPQPAFANAPGPPPVTAEPLLEEKSGASAVCVTPRCVAANKDLSGAKGDAIPAVTCKAPPAVTGSKVLVVPAPVLAAPEPRWIGARKPSGSTACDFSAAIAFSAELSMEQVPISFSPLLDVVKAKEQCDVSPASSGCQVVGPQKAAHRPTMVHATQSTPLNSRRMRLLNLCLSLTDWSARGRKRLLPAVHSPRWRQVIANLLSRLKHPLQSVGAWCRRSPAQRGGCQSVVSFTQWLRMMASVYEWLRQPYDPMQWRLPHSWLCEARRMFSQKRM